jgi:crossover junction endodeoxyribonuclease RuvC
MKAVSIRHADASRETQATRPGFHRVLGVDPAASGPTGYGVVETDGRGCRTIHYGATPSALRKHNDFSARLCEIHELISDLIDEYSPAAMAIESVFTALNMRTALMLAEMRGVVQLAAAQRGVTVCNYSPREVKACVAGYGNASKEQMQIMVRAMLAMQETPQPSDAADALAVALCHIYTARSRARIAAAMAPHSANPGASPGSIPGTPRRAEPQRLHR